MCVTLPNTIRNFIPVEQLCAFSCRIILKLPPTPPFSSALPSQQTNRDKDKLLVLLENPPNPFWESLTSEILGAGCYDGFHGGRSSVVPRVER